MHSSWLIRFSAIVILIGSLSVAQAQSITNGDFEGGFTNNVGNGWSSWIDSGWDTASFADGTDRYVSASHSQKVNAGQPGGPKCMGIYQQVNTAMDGTYTFSVSHYHSVSESYGCENMELYMALDPYGTLNKSTYHMEWHQMSCTKDQWITQNFNVVAKSTKVTIYLEVRRKCPQGGMGYAWFDNVTVSGPPPDPTYTPTVTVTHTPTQPPPIGPELLTNGNMENFTSGLANGWSSWSTNGSGYWKQSSLVGKSGGGTYHNPVGWYEDFVAMNAKTYLLGNGYGAADSLEEEDHLEDSIIIGRCVLSNEHLGEIYEGDYQAVAVWLANHYEIEANYHPRVDAWLGQNEPDWGIHWQRSIDFEIYFTQQMHQRKLQSVVLSMAVGTPGDMDRILDCKDLFEICDYYGHHVYGGPADQLMVLPTVEEWATEDPYLYALRCRNYAKMYRDRGWRFPPVIYTEGTTFGGWHDNWVTSTQVRDDLIAMIPFMNEDRWSVGLCIFDNGGPGVWEAWDVTGYNICAPVGQANNADPADKTSGLYSQKFGVGDLHCKVGGCTRNGVFTGGVVQAVSGLTVNETYLLEFDFKWARSNGASNMTFCYGLDWTGQTNNGNAGTIAWSSDLISLYDLPHQIFKHHYDVFSADSSSVSIWFRAHQNLNDVPIRVTLDSVSLRQVSGEVQPTHTFTPTNTRTNTPTNTPTSSGLLNGNMEGGFTNGTANNWTKYVTNGNPTFSDGTDYYQGGSHSQKIVYPQPSGNGYAGLYQNVACSPSQSGTLTGWKRDISGAGDYDIVCRLGYDLTGGTNPQSGNVVWSEFNCTPHATWISKSVNFNTTGNSVTVFIEAWHKGWGGTHTAWLDSVTLTGIGGPAATFTNTPTNTRTNTPTNTRTNTPTNTRTNTPTNTRTITPTTQCGRTGETIGSLTNTSFATSWNYSPEPQNPSGWTVLQWNSGGPQYYTGYELASGRPSDHRCKFEFSSGSTGTEHVLYKEISWGNYSSVNVSAYCAGRQWGGGSTGTMSIGVDLNGCATNWNQADYTNSRTSNNESWSTVSLSNLQKPQGAQTFTLMIRANRSGSSWNCQFDEVSVTGN